MSGSARLCIGLVSDDPARSNRLAELLGRRFHITASNLDAFNAEGGDSLSYVVDADLSNPETIARIREKVTRALPGRDKYFVINDESRTDLVQANSLGARDVLRKSCMDRDAALLIDRLNQSLVADLWSDRPADTQLALSSVTVLNDNLYSAVATGSPLPKAQAADCCAYLIANLENESLGPWLDAVRRHHSYTYRHSMIVSGLAVCFALYLGMRRADTERIALGALMHDIGKMRLPLGLLDKPGALTEAEREEINKHPEYGARLLQADKQFAPEIVAIARMHHEFLDGGGYPEGLTGEAIPDPVRIMTVVDIFAALIDERSYKPAMPSDQAYAIMTGMEGKLDMDIVRAFKPVALNAAAGQAPAPGAMARQASQGGADA